MNQAQLEELRLRANIQYVAELGGNLKEGSIEKDRYIEGYVAGAMRAAEANAALEQERDNLEAERDALERQRENLQTTVDMDLVYMRLVEAERDAANAVIANVHAWAMENDINDAFNPPTVEDFWHRITDRKATS